MNEKHYIERIWSNRKKLKCSTIVVQAGPRKWLCCSCEKPHDILSPKRAYLREWYRRRGKHMRIKYRNEGRCTNCGKTLVGSSSTVYCVGCHAYRLDYQRRSRQRRALAINDMLYGGRADFQREQISAHPMNLTREQINQGMRG